jgi:hypothetical protein
MEWFFEIPLVKMSIGLFGDLIPINITLPQMDYLRTTVSEQTVNVITEWTAPFLFPAIIMMIPYMILTGALIIAASFATVIISATYIMTGVLDEYRPMSYVYFGVIVCGIVLYARQKKREKKE